LQASRLGYELFMTSLTAISQPASVHAMRREIIRSVLFIAGFIAESFFYGGNSCFVSRIYSRKKVAAFFPDWKSRDR